MMAYSTFNTLRTGLMRPTMEFCNEHFPETAALLDQLYDLSCPAEFNYYLDKLTTYINRITEKEIVKRHKRNLGTTAFPDSSILGCPTLGSQYVPLNRKYPINSGDYVERGVNENYNLSVNEQSNRFAKPKNVVPFISVEDMDQEFKSQKSEEIANKKVYSNISVISNNTFNRCTIEENSKNGLNRTVHSKSHLSDIEEEDMEEKEQGITNKSVKDDNTHYIIRDWTLKKLNKKIVIVGTLLHKTTEQLIKNNCHIDVHSRPDKSVIRSKGNYYHLDGKFISNPGIPSDIRKQCGDSNFPRLWKSLFKSWSEPSSGKENEGKKIKAVDFKKKLDVKTPEVKISAKRKRSDTPNTEVPVRRSEKSPKLNSLKTKKGDQVLTPTSSSKGKTSNITKKKTPQSGKRRSTGENTGTPYPKKTSSMTKKKTPQSSKKRSIGQSAGTPLTKKGKYDSGNKDKTNKKEKINAQKLKDDNKENKSAKGEVTMKESLRNEILASQQDLKERRRSPSDFFNNLDYDINDGVGGDNENKFMSASDCLRSAKKESDLSGRVTPPNIGFECFLNKDGKNISATPHNHNKAINRKFNCVVKRMAAAQSKKGTKQPDPGKKLKNECASSKEVNRLLAAITTKSGSTPKVVKEAFRHEPNSSDADSLSVDSDQCVV